MTSKAFQAKITVLIPAAGAGSRAGGGLPKQYRPLAGQAMIRWTVAALKRLPFEMKIVPVIAPAFKERCLEALQGLGVERTVPGGADRQGSVLAGLEALTADPPDYVLIHDAARPFVTAATVAAVVEALEGGAQAAIPAVPVADTLKREADGHVGGTVERAGLYRAQTPQGFAYKAILAAHRQCADRGLTDDAAVMEAAGHRVRLVPGDPDNDKVTTVEDLVRAERRLLNTLPDIRVGQGFDVHSLGDGDGVWLGGVKIPFAQGLIGHSDADVALHALTDAILGAIGAGDIGQHFPPSEMRWRGAASDRFLAHAASLVAERGGMIAHLDLTIICEAPKVGPYRAAITARIAEILDLDPGRVSVKATTTEKLGFTGRREGIAAQATATVRLP